LLWISSIYLFVLGKKDVQNKRGHVEDGGWARQGKGGWRSKDGRKEGVIRKKEAEEWIINSDFYMRAHRQEKGSDCFPE